MGRMSYAEGPRIVHNTHANDLERAFKAYCMHGTGGGKDGPLYEMDGTRWAKWCRESGVVGGARGLCSLTSVDVAFSKSRAGRGGGRRVDYLTLRGHLVPLLARDAGVPPAHVVALLSAACTPLQNTTNTPSSLSPSPFRLPDPPAPFRKPRELYAARAARGRSRSAGLPPQQQQEQQQGRTSHRSRSRSHSRALAAAAAADYQQPSQAQRRGLIDVTDDYVDAASASAPAANEDRSGGGGGGTFPMHGGVLFSDAPTHVMPWGKRSPPPPASALTPHAGTMSPAYPEASLTPPPPATDVPHASYGGGSGRGWDFRAARPPPGKPASSAYGDSPAYGGGGGEFGSLRSPATPAVTPPLPSEVLRSTEYFLMHQASEYRQMLQASPGGL